MGEPVKRGARRAKSLPCRAAVEATLLSLGVDAVSNARGQLALTLADALDAGAGMAAAAIARELRATLAELEAVHDDGGSELANFLAGLSAEVGDKA